MISIIIPLYNKENYIGETLNSIFNQTYKDFEIIVVNDGSTDESLRVVNTFTDKRIRVYTIKNSGVSVARNIGILKSKYDYIGFLDADDYWEKYFLGEMIKLIIAYPEEKIFAAGRTSLFKDRKIQYQNPFLPDIGEVSKIDYLKVISQFLPPVHTSDSVFKKSALLEAGLFKEGQRQHEDHDLWLRVCQKHLVVYINKPLSFYRKDIENSGSQSNIRYLDFKEYLQTILETKKAIDYGRLKYFKKYYNKFILFTFIKHQVGFKKGQAKQLLPLIQNIVSPFYFNLILLVNLMPSGLTYKLICQFKK